MKKLLVVIALMFLVGCNKQSGKTSSSFPQTKEEMLAQIDAANPGWKERLANHQPAKTQGIKVLSVKWRGPYALTDLLYQAE